MFVLLIISSRAHAGDDNVATTTIQKTFPSTIDNACTVHKQKPQFLLPLNQGGREPVKTLVKTIPSCSTARLDVPLTV